MMDIPSVAFANLVLEELQGNPSLERLKELKREMTRRRFNSPPKFWLKNLKQEKETDEKELADKKKHIQIFMHIISMKKFAYTSTSLRIYATSLRERLSEHLATHVPEDGNYINTLASLRYNAVLAFKDIYQTLSTFGEHFHTSYALVEDGGLTYFVREHYARATGLDIKKLRKRSRIRPLIGSPFVRKLLVAAGVSFSFHELERTFEEDDDELKHYNSILSEHNVPSYSRVDAIDGHDALKARLAEEGFGTLSGTAFESRDDLIGKLTSRRSFFFSRMKEVASREIAKEILLALKDRRIPSLARNPSPIQLKALHYLDPTLDVEEVLN